MVITYDAILTKDAVVRDEVTNTAGLDYQNDDSIDVQFDEVKVKTYGYQFTRRRMIRKTDLQALNSKCMQIRNASRN